MSPRIAQSKPLRKGASIDQVRLRRDPIARRIVTSWRRLTDNAATTQTLVACSGGADSTALALALASAKIDIVIAHILHDLRPIEEAEADRDTARHLADILSAPFVEQSITIGSGNKEGQARNLRYDSLTEMACQHACPFVASGHHADDQLESMVMALARGAGLHGLRGAAPSRPLTDSVTLIRPMLRTTRDEARALCESAGITWREDESNQDTSRTRAALRHGPLALLSKITPSAATHAARSAELLRDAAGVVDDRAREIFADDFEWPRNTLRAERAIVLGSGLRRAALRLTNGAHADALTGNLLDPSIRAIKDDSTEPRTFDWPAGLRLSVAAHTVALAYTDR